VFNIVLADVPEGKTELVQGHFELPAPTGAKYFILTTNAYVEVQCKTHWIGLIVVPCHD
jgi:hypothetical protein